MELRERLALANLNPKATRHVFRNGRSRTPAPNTTETKGSSGPTPLKFQTSPGAAPELNGSGAGNH